MSEMAHLSLCKGKKIYEVYSLCTASPSPKKFGREMSV